MDKLYIKKNSGLDFFYFVEYKIGYPFHEYF
jgi:hypothetical protein